MGTLFTQPVVRATTAETLQFLKDHRTEVVITRPQASRPWYEASLRGRIAIVSGAEDRGLDPAWRDAASQDVALPMAGFADSLNLAAATAILLYEAVRQRGSDQAPTASTVSVSSIRSCVRSSVTIPDLFTREPPTSSVPILATPGPSAIAPYW